MKKSDRKQDRRIIITGFILGALVIVACVIGFFCVRSYIESLMARSDSKQASLSQTMQQELNEADKPETVTNTPEAAQTETTVPTNVVTVWPDTQLQVTESPYSQTEAAETYATPEPTETPTPVPAEAVTAEVVSASEVDTSGYAPVGISYASASSTIVQEGYDNSAAMMFDLDPTTSWQEGVDGNGEGESIYAAFDRTYSVRYITLKLGNWRSEENWAANARPSGLTIWIGGAGYQMSFSDSMAEFCLVFSGDVSASDMSITINSAYSAENADTCISEITVYGV